MDDWNRWNDDIDMWLEDETEALIRDISCLVEIPSVALPDAGMPSAALPDTAISSAALPGSAMAEKSSDAPYGPECQKVLVKGEELFKRYGFPSRRFQNKVISCQLGVGERTLGIWGHLDVVPATGMWRYDPFTCVREGDFLLGRGTQDNKGPAVAALYALRYIKERNIPLHQRVTLYLGSCEEVGMTDVEDYLKESEAPDFSFIADCGFPVCYGEKGIIEAELSADNRLETISRIAGGTVTNSIPDSAVAVVNNCGGLDREVTKELTVEAAGIAGHAAFPDGAVNAIGVLAGKLLSMGQVGKEAEENESASCDSVLTPNEISLCKFLVLACQDGYGTGLGLACQDSLSGRLTASCSVIESIQQSVTLKFNIRYPIQADSREIRRKLEAIAGQYHFKLTYFHDSPPSYYDPESAEVKSLMAAYREELKQDSPAYVMGGGTYARKIPRAVGFGPGLPADLSSLNLKPGEGSCHAVNEAQSLTNLKKAIKIYIKAILKLDQIEGEEEYENN